VQAVILAGGEGTRLRPLTSTVPKPVLPLANRPFISYMIDWLEAHGFDDVVMSCGFLASEVRSVLGEGERGRVRIRYVEEDEPLGTAGAVKNAEPLLDGTFAVLNGDVLADFDLGALRRFHLERGAIATIALIGVDDPSAYGLVRTAANGEILAFLEKPSPEEIDTDQINAGAYVLEPEVLDRIEPGCAVSFEREVFPSLIGSGLYGFEAKGYWLDIGTPERYLEGTFDILERRVDTVVGRSLGDGGLAVGDGSLLAADARLLPPALIGARVGLETEALVGPRGVVGSDCEVGEGATVEDAVVHDRVQIGSGAVVRESIVGPGAVIGAGSRIDRGVVIGAEAVIEPGSVLANGERVEPGVESSPDFA
jgi:mannose-1-phosphate guanylyltransferase